MESIVPAIYYYFKLHSFYSYVQSFIEEMDEEAQRKMSGKKKQKHESIGRTENKDEEL